MDYFTHYINLVDSRKSRPLMKEEGYEIHHIIPRCMEGEDEEFNLVKLSYKEHLLAHKLLAKIFFDNKKLQYAVNAMLIEHPDREKQRQHMRDHNPMFDMSTRKKMSETRKAKFAEGKLTPRNLTDREKRMHSERMKKHNPMTKEPWKNHTASPVRVYYKDKSTKDFLYMKEITLITGVPYDTLKYMSRNGCGSPKWGIERLEKL